MKEVQRSKFKVQSGKNRIVFIDRLKKDQEFKVADDEKNTFIIFLCDGDNQCGNIRVIIEGDKADIEILGIIVGQGRQQIELRTLQHHLRPDSRSCLFIKSILFDKAQFHYRGLIKIEKGAQRSDAYQKNQNLLMSPSALINSRPYLEIMANDVQCTHGVTIGKIDEEQLYYLTTRGLSNKEATKLLLVSFFQDVIQKIPEEALQIECKKKISDIISKLLERSKN